MKRVSISEALIESMLTTGSIQQFKIDSGIPPNSMLVTVSYIKHKGCVELLFDVGDNNAGIEEMGITATVLTNSQQKSTNSSPSNPNDAYNRAMKPFSG